MIPFMSLKCICHSILVAPRKQKQHLKSCCRGGQNQMLLMDNFITSISKTMYCFIWNKQLSYFSKLCHLLRSRSPALCIKRYHHFPQRVTISHNSTELLLNHWSYSTIIPNELKHSILPWCLEPFFCTYLCLFLKASNLTDAAKITAEQLVLALELSLL